MYLVIVYLCICSLSRVYLFEPIHSIGDGLAGPSETLTVKNCPRLVFLSPLIIGKMPSSIFTILENTPQNWNIVDVLSGQEKRRL